MNLKKLFKKLCFGLSLLGCVIGLTSINSFAYTEYVDTNNQSSDLLGITYLTQLSETDSEDIDTGYYANVYNVSSYFSSFFVGIDFMPPSDDLPFNSYIEFLVSNTLYNDYDTFYDVYADGVQDRIYFSINRISSSNFHFTIAVFGSFQEFKGQYLYIRYYDGYNEGYNLDLDNVYVSNAVVPLGNLQSQVASLTSQNADLQSDIQVLTNRNATLNSSVISLTNDNATLQSQVNSLTNQVSNLNNTISSLQSDIVSLQSSLDNLTTYDYDLKDLLFSVGALPFASFSQIWNVNFLGYNIAQTILGFITLLIIFAIIKIFFVGK